MIIMVVTFLFTVSRHLILPDQAILGISASYLTNKNQFEPINGLSLDLVDTICGVPQCYIFDPFSVSSLYK